MGCCQSNTSGEENAPPPNQLRASTQSDTALASSHPGSNAHSDSPSSSNGPAQPTVGAKNTKRPNKPIRSPSPLRNSPANVSYGSGPWTRAQLARERTAFFETRVAGRQEIWTALKLVCELLQQGNIADAQGILDAMNMTCPSGRVASGRGRDRVTGGVYDERGELYELPTWVVTDPEDVTGLEISNEDDRDDGGHDEKAVDSDDPSSSSEHIDRIQTLEHKGKGRAADVGEQISLRLRLSDRGTDVVVTAGMKEPVLAIVRRVREQIGLKRVRLVCLGHVLRESKSLAAQGYKPGNVINAYVFDGPEDMLKPDVTR